MGLIFLWVTSPGTEYDGANQSKSELYQLKISYQQFDFPSSPSSLSSSFFVNSQQHLRAFDLFMELGQSTQATLCLQLRWYTSDM